MYTITGTAGSETVEPFCVEEGDPLGSPCQLAVWGEDINVFWETDHIGGAYVNILIDWDQDGQWGGSGNCSGGTTWDEHVLVNFPVPEGNGNLGAQNPPAFQIGPNSGYVWMRVTITEEEIELPWDGSGVFASGETEDHLIRVSEVMELYDFGDAPSPYPTTSQQNGARHTMDEAVYLGQGVDTEADGQPDSTATGDDKHGSDDEDGVEWLQELVPNDTARVRVTASTGGFLKGWIDFNRDGDWEDDEEEVCDSQVGEGANELQVFVPDDAVEGPTYTRFRFSDEIIPSFEGEINGGEVEDMRIFVENFRFYDYGDAPDNDTLHYPTLLENNGARHSVSDTIYLRDFDHFAYTPSPPPDVEGDGQPTLDAEGDNDNNLDDEQGTYFWKSLVPGDTSSIIVDFRGIGTLHGWFDWNQDGDWRDTDEYAIWYEPSSDGIHFVEVSVPETALLGATYARFRYSTDPLLAHYGRGGYGEVEDRKCTISANGYDYGDAPDSYGTLKPNGASHKVQKLISLGTFLDAEPDGQPNNDALSDDNDVTHFDDEDGVVFSEMIPGEESSFQILTWGKVWPYFLPRLHGWIDFNQDRDFKDPGEKIFEGFIVENGSHTYLRTIPADAHLGYTYARFRFTNYPLDTLGPVGANIWAGEVEDYRVRIGGMLHDFGDAPYPFPTFHQDNGARHTINPDIYLGSGVSADEDGQPDSLASGDDDDGVTFHDAWIPGDTVKATVTASTNGYLSIWYAPAPTETDNISKIAISEDFPYKQIGIELLKGKNTVDIVVEESKFSPGIGYMRFRFSTQPIDSVGGIAPDGEVEDYLINVILKLMYEYGDAPECSIAYPHTGQIGAFPTC